VRFACSTLSSNRRRSAEWRSAGDETIPGFARSLDMMLLVFSLIAATPLLGLSLWMIDEAYGDRLAPRLRARINEVSDRWLKP